MNTTMTKRMLLIASLLALLGMAAAGAQAPKTPAGDAKNGKRIYTAYGCYECHGREGQGGAAGKRLAPHPIALADFIHYCRHPTGEMPPYTSRVVTDAELADIHAFLATIPEAPAATR